MSDDDLPDRERELVARELGEAIVGHVLNESVGAASVEVACERLADLEDDERDDALTTLTCSHCGRTVPMLCWTELDMAWRCPNCGLRMQRNDGVRR